MKYTFLPFVLLVAWMSPTPAVPAVWPQYRADGSRSGYTAECLADALHLQWTYHAPHAPRPAWPDVYWQRQTYDLAYQPVVADGMLFYGSSADCKVYALDAADGQEKWTFFTDAPVRFAPAVWRDRVFVASDDGYLYCLAAADGTLLWRKRGGLGDQKILGNGRLVSRWPVRGGPVVHNDVLYFGAGLFPSHGFFLYALDPESGEVLWVNDTSGNIRQNHVTGGYSFGNVTSQGYLVVSGDTLVVPTGRAVPAAYDRHTGEFKYFRALELAYAGGSWVMAIDHMVFNSDLILRLETGYTLCNKVGNAKEQIAVRERPKDAEVMIEAAASPAPLSVDGRLYVQASAALKCIDAYNGRPIWETPIARFKWARCYNGSEVVGSNYCVTADSVYISAYDRCRRLDGITGKELASFDTPRLGQTDEPCWMQVFVKDDLLLGTLASEPMEKGWSRPGTKQVERCIAISGLTTAEEATRLFAMDRHTGRLRWSFAPQASIIPNSVAIGGGRVYLIDRPIVNPAQSRRGRNEVPPGRLVALDAQSGRVLWTHEKNVFGSMLAVSEPHDVVLMGNDVKERGTLFCDYPQRLAVFRGNDGAKLWEEEVMCKQRPMIIDRTIVAEGHNLDFADRNNASKQHHPSAWDLLTGAVKTRSNPVTGRQEPWVYGRSTKCSYVSSSANLILFRNAMTTYFDLACDEGQSNLGAFRPSCFINLLPVGGIVVAPNTVSGCQCNTLMRTSLALVPMEQEDHWTAFCGKEPEAGIVRHLHLNLGALGDRHDGHGRLWLAMPRPPGYFAGHRSDTKTLRLDRVVTLNGLKPAFHFKYDMAAMLKQEKGISTYRLNANTAEISGSDIPWVAGSGCRGPVDLEINVSRMPPDTEYLVRLHFAELDAIRPGQRVFDVVVGERTVRSDFDVVRVAGNTNLAVAEELTARSTGGKLRLTLVPKKGQPTLAGVEILAMDADGQDNRPHSAPRTSNRQVARTLIGRTSL